MLEINKKPEEQTQNAAPEQLPVDGEITEAEGTELAEATENDAEVTEVAEPGAEQPEQEV